MSNYFEYFLKNSQMTEGRQLAIALFLNDIGLFNTRKLLKYIYEHKLIPLKMDHSNPTFKIYDKYFKDIFFVARKLWQNV